jgi:hypothetical protein
LLVLPPGRELPPREGRAVCELDDGRLVVWEPEVHCGAIACHAERLGYERPERDSVIKRFGLPRGSVAFACAWTRIEVVATLLGISPWSWLARGARSSALRVRTVTMVRPELGIVVSLGLLPMQ